MPAILAKRTHPRRFVPDSLDATNPQAVTGLYEQLQKRDISTLSALEAFILDWEELSAVLAEGYAAAYVDMTADTSNPAFEAKYTYVVENVLPIFQQCSFALKQRLLKSPALDRLSDEYEMFLRDVRAEVELYREENVALQVEERKQDQEYEKVSGS